MMGKFHQLNCTESESTFDVYDGDDLLNIDITDFIGVCNSVYLSAEDEEKLRVLLNKRKDSKE